MPTQPAKDFNRILTEEVLMPMLAVADFDERRAIFREQVHRAFEPAFLPTLLHVLSALREILPQQDRDAAPQLLAAIMFELRDFLAPIPSVSLSAEAIAIELLTASIAADLGNLSHISDEDPFLALLRVIVRREAFLANETEAVAVALDRFAEAVEARADADNPAASRLREQSEIWRELPDQIQLARRLLSLARGENEEEVRQAFDRQPPADPGDALVMVVSLREALEAEGLLDDAEGARQLMFRLLAEGVARERPMADLSDESSAVSFGERYRREPDFLTAGDLAQYAEDERQHELIGGELFVSPPLDQHAQDIISTIQTLLSTFVEAHQLGAVYTAPLTIKLSEHDVVRPALAFVGRQQLNASAGEIAGIPDLVIEVKTESTNEAALGAKTNLYGRVGIRECWLIVDTQWHQALQAYGQEHGHWVLFGMDPVVRSRVLPGLEVRLADVLPSPVDC